MTNDRRGLSAASVLRQEATASPPGSPSLRARARGRGRSSVLAEAITVCQERIAQDKATRLATGMPNYTYVSPGKKKRG